MPMVWLMAVAAWLSLWAGFLTLVALDQCGPRTPLTLLDGLFDNRDAEQRAEMAGKHVREAPERGGQGWTSVLPLRVSRKPSTKPASRCRSPMVSRASCSVAATLV